MTNMTGHCLCGAVHFKTTAAPAFAANCHCTDCRRATGSAYATLVFFKRDEVAIEGETKSYTHTADSGSQMTKHFCPTCGSQMFGTNSARESMIAVRAGAIDQTDQVKPLRNVFVASKIDSTPLDPALPATARMP